MTSNQLFPSLPEQVALTYHGIWLTTKKRDRSDKEIVRDAAAAVAARNHRRGSSKGSGGSVRLSGSTTEWVSRGSQLEMPANQ